MGVTSPLGFSKSIDRSIDWGTNCEEGSNPNEAPDISAGGYEVGLEYIPYGELI